MAVYGKIKDFILDLGNPNSNPIFFGKPVYYLDTDFLYYELKKLKSVFNQSVFDICWRQFGANLTRLPPTEIPTSNLSTLY